MLRFLLLFCVGLAPALAAVLPPTDNNGERAPYIRVIHRAADTVDTAWQAYAHQLPAACDVTLVDGDDMPVDMEAAVNNTGNDVICVAPGADLGTGRADITRTSCPNPIWVIRSDYNNHAPSDYSNHVANLPANQQARVGAFDLESDNNCLMIFYGLYFTDPYGNYPWSVDCPGNTFRYIVSHSEVRGGLSTQGCRGDSFGAHYNIITTDINVPNTDRECYREGAKGGLGAGQGHWVSHNEIRDCHGDWVAASGATDLRYGNFKIWYNDMESSVFHKTDCFGAAVLDNTSPCHAGENAIDLKSGNLSDTSAEWIEIVGNRVRGFRLNDDQAPDGGGSGAGATGAFDLQLSSEFAVVRDNIVWDVHFAVAASNLSTLPNGPRRHSIVGNIFSLKTFDVTPATLFCSTATPPGALNCSGFNHGFIVNYVDDIRVAFNTIVFDITAGVTPTFYQSNTRDNQIVGNIWVNGGAYSGGIGGGWEVDCNAWVNTTPLTDATNTYVGALTLTDRTVWVDPITNPRQITITGVTRPDGDASIGSLCNGVTIDVNGFGSTGNDGIAN